MNVAELSVDPDGLWSPAQASRVLAIINREVAGHGLIFCAVSVSVGNTMTRVILVAYCVEHDIAVAEGSVCKICQRHAKDTMFKAAFGG